MVSVGRPDKGKELVSHLGLERGEEILFVDPDNKLYDALDLNRGVQRTFFNTNTAFAFLRRFTSQDGTKELKEVLPKWKDAVYIPPRQDQAFLQGGTFVFDGPRTIFAHYDPSTAAHASIEEVMETAISAVQQKTAVQAE